MAKSTLPEIKEFSDFLNEKGYPCIAAKAALAKKQVSCLVVGHMGCPAHDPQILAFLYQFIARYRKATAESARSYHAAAIIFQHPTEITDEMFDMLLWQRLQALADLDAQKYPYDNRVEANPQSPHFSFSLMEEAFFVIGMHPASSREARRFKLPCLVFNPHAQFEMLRNQGKYESLKKAIRRRDQKLTGSNNPLLKDFGEASEVYQYSGRQHDKDWRCPLNVKHGRAKHNSSS